MQPLASILASTVLVSLMSFVGVFLLLFREATNKVLLMLVGFAAGALLGGAFLHLLPEAVQASSYSPNVFVWVLLGLMVFFAMERFLRWYHCLRKRYMASSFTYLSLLGDALHNFMDGMAIAASFLVRPELGLATTLAVIFHEIPQELGDFAILLYGGFSRTRAVLYNFASALTAIAGALVVYFSSMSLSGLTGSLVPFAAGNFIYLAGSDLIPELTREERTPLESLAQTLFLIIGVMLMWFLMALLE